ncbi:MAG: zincin-like metallopeptidase domain-containing protein [Candidatus Acidiferrales bacterium]|jgi:antirestriction protein ArdC
MTEKIDIYTRITNRIVSDLENGVKPWLKPWNAEHAAGRITRPLRHNATPYRGINVLVLWITAEERGYACPLWMTYKQSIELGGQVRKGEHGATVVYADRFKKTEAGDDGQMVEQEIPFMKPYTVFNCEQIDNLPTEYYALAQAPNEKIERIDRAEAFFANAKPEIKHGGNMAYYAMKNDYIQMPPFEAFRDAEAYYATLAHESTHWTRHEKRLNRDFGRKRFGDEGYAVEELVAELGSAFLCADLQLTPETREDHASYIANWLTVLRNDKRAIFTPAAHAERAAAFLHGLQPGAVAADNTRAAA